MSEFWFKHPVGKFLLDVLVGGVIGAAVATIGLSDTVSGREAIGLILGGAQGGIRSAASSALLVAIKTLRGG